MTDILQVVQTTPICYVTRDLERAEGFGQSTPGFFVITNSTAYARQKAEQNQSILCIESEDILSTAELLQHEQTTAFLEKNNLTRIVVFKPTTQIERLCAEQNRTLLNPSAKLAATVEEKISQIDWLGDLSEHMPSHYVAPLKDVAFADEPMIVQFNRAHTGTGTMLVESKEQLEELQKQFPNRPAKVSAVVDGFTVTVNAVVGSDILVSSISYQITGLAPFTTRTFATVGNDYALPKQLLEYKQQTQVKELANTIGKKLKQDGWKGAFGIDVMIDRNTQEVFLLEINARQPASVSFESQMQLQQKSKRSQALTTFEAHVFALLEQDFPSTSLVPVEQAAQITLRNQQHNIDLELLQQELKEYTTIPYENTDFESDLLRIQSQDPIMQADGIFNSTGQQIVNHITNNL